MTSTATTANVEEIWFKSQRAIRSAFQATVIGLPIVLSIIAAAQEQVDWPWLGGLFAIGVSLQAFLAKVMANPAIDAWLSTHTFLGSVPKAVATSDAVEEPEPEEVEIVEPEEEPLDDDTTGESREPTV